MLFTLLALLTVQLNCKVVNVISFPCSLQIKPLENSWWDRKFKMAFTPAKSHIAVPFFIQLVLLFQSGGFADGADSFTCPDKGQFPHPTSCAQYYTCTKGGEKTDKLTTCPAKQNFDRFHKTCKPWENVNCNLCNNDGAYPDWTSRPHFIRCKNGVADRYKCKQGEFNAGYVSCGSSKTKVDIQKEAILDMPKDMDTYAISWRSKYKEVKDKPQLRQRPSKKEPNPGLAVLENPDNSIPDCDPDFHKAFCFFNFLICAVCVVAGIV